MAHAKCSVIYNALMVQGFITLIIRGIIQLNTNNTHIRGLNLSSSMKLQAKSRPTCVSVCTQCKLFGEPADTAFYNKIGTNG